MMVAAANQLWLFCMLKNMRYIPGFNTNIELKKKGRRILIICSTFLSLYKSVGNVVGLSVLSVFGVIPECRMSDRNNNSNHEFIFLFSFF